MRMIRYLSAVLLLFFLSSCSSEEESIYSTLFNAGEYQQVIDNADTVLSRELNADALYFRTLSYYRLGFFEEAEDGAWFFLLTQSHDKKYYYETAEILIRATDDYSLALFAGNILYDAGRLNRVDYIPYYRALIAEGELERADSFYQAVLPTLSPYALALMNVRSRSSSDRITASLENLYDVSGLSAEFISLMEEAIPLFIRRGDQSMLLSLIDYGYAGDSYYALYIGDLFFSLGRLDDAAKYWAAAMDSYPLQYGIRIQSL